VFLPQALGVEITIWNSCKASCNANRCPYESPNSTSFTRQHTRRVWPTLLTKTLCRMSSYTCHWDRLTRSAIENFGILTSAMSSSRTYWPGLLLSIAALALAVGSGLRDTPVPPLNQARTTDTNSVVRIAHKVFIPYQDVQCIAIKVANIT
jgi:hypothetical protein